MRRFLPLTLLAVAGCGTISDTASWGRPRRDPGPHVFGGVRSDWDRLNGGGCCRTAALGPCFLFDLPLSAAADVVMLPFTVPAALFRPRPLTAEEATSP